MGNVGEPSLCSERKTTKSDKRASKSCTQSACTGCMRMRRSLNARNVRWSTSQAVKASNVERKRNYSIVHFAVTVSSGLQIGKAVIQDKKFVKFTVKVRVSPSKTRVHPRVPDRSMHSDELENKEAMQGVANVESGHFQDSDGTSMS